MSRLIGLGGYAFSGKDAFADVLEKNHGWYKTYMSKALRESLDVLNPIVGVDNTRGVYIRFREMVNTLGYEEAKKHREVRELLQRMGTEVGRKLWSEDFWVDLCFKDAVKHLGRGELVVITGIRYPNELTAIQNLEGVSIWVSRPGYSAINEHSSDNSLTAEDFDEVFHNNGTLADLEENVPHFLTSMDLPNYLRGWRDIPFEGPKFS